MTKVETNQTKDGRKKSQKNVEDAEESRRNHQRWGYKYEECGHTTCGHTTEV